MHALPYHAESFLNSLLEGATDGHDLAHGLHRRPQLLVNTTELGEVPSGNLADYIVEGWLEEGAGGLGHGVLQLKEAIPHAQLGSDECQGIARGLAGKCRRARKSGVNFDDSVVFRLWVEGILHVAFANDAYVTDNLDGKGTKLMVFRISEGLRGSYDNALAGMDAERVEVLHVANGDAVVVTVANHLVFYFLPTLE